MKSVRLPIFRSSVQAAVMEVLFVRASEALTLTEIAERAGVSLAAVHKEVERLERSGLVESRRRGRNRLVSASQESAYYPELRSLLTMAFGPVALLRTALAGVAGVESAFVFGSWAATEGVDSGRVPRDIDVMVIGEPSLDELYEAIRSVEDRIGHPVNPTVRSRSEWEADRSGFAEQVRSNPRIEVLG